MTRYRVTHRTSYRYGQPVLLCHNEARLQPRSTCWQRLVDYEFSVQPTPRALAMRHDSFGNVVHYFSVEELHTALDVVSISEVDVEWPTSVELAAPLAWEEAVAQIRSGMSDEDLEARSFALDSPIIAMNAAAVAYAQDSFPPGRDLLEAIRDLVERIHRDFTFDAAITTVATPIAEVLSHRRGVCQDFAHLIIGCLRSKGIPARYVSGYIETQPPEGSERLVGADASHAWAQAYVPGWGWVDVDPTNNQMPVTSHVTVAWGRDYNDVAPLKGVVVGGGPHALDVAVDVVRVDAESPVRASD